MSAYIIVDTRIKNPEAYEDYKAKARPIAEKFGGVYLARGGDMDVVQDELWSPTRNCADPIPEQGQSQGISGLRRICAGKGIATCQRRLHLGVG